MNKSHLTAIVRNKLPLPTRMLRDKGLLTGRILDYGCGRSHAVNQRFFPGIAGYDPYFHPEGITDYQYDTIICNYVLCVLRTQIERNDVLFRIGNLLTPDGFAYVTVRTDLHPEGEGWLTSKGTFQYGVRIYNARVLYTRGFLTYEIKKGDNARSN